MKSLDHPNICKLLATFEESKKMFFVMELCEGGELFDRIIETGTITEPNTADIIAQVSHALHYAHERGIAHRDIKPENVVFANKNDNLVKLIDWGLAQAFLESPMSSAVGTFAYAAPEVLDSKNVKSYTHKCDLWSLGVLTYVMLCGKPPFWGSEAQHLRKAKKEQYPMKGAPWDTINEDAKNFVQRLIKANPDDRMPMAEVVLHPWLKRAKSAAVPSKTESDSVLHNLKQFCNKSTFTRMCITAVARQLDHKHVADIHKVFRLLDKNGDGVLSFDEISGGFGDLFGVGSEEYKNVKDTFENLDLDGSDSIDYTEFCAAGLGEKTCTQDEVVWAAFKSFDLDNTGFVKIADLTKILDNADVRDAWSADVCAGVAKEIVDQYDKDGDGKISFDDWKTMMSNMWKQAQQGEIMGMNTYDMLRKVADL